MGNLEHLVERRSDRESDHRGDLILLGGAGLTINGDRREGGTGQMEHQGQEEQRQKTEVEADRNSWRRTPGLGTLCT